MQKQPSQRNFALRTWTIAQIRNAFSVDSEQHAAPTNIMASVV